MNKKSALSGGAIGFVLGALVTLGGCTKSSYSGGYSFALIFFGGIICSVPGLIIGGILGKPDEDKQEE